MQWTAHTLGVYISVPFCRAKCSFCNFASGVGSAEAMVLYVDHLCREIVTVRAVAGQAGLVLPERVDSVYFGGGTPSLLAPRELDRIFTALRGEFRVEDGVEVTLEAAPGQIAGELLEAALRQGVNRVSLGVQSFVDAEAQAVGRSHTGRSCADEFRRLRRAGVNEVGADLIAGLPLQTERSWAESLGVAADSELDHLSVYMLEVDAQSRLGREVLGGGARLQAPAVPSDDVIAAMYESACERLPAAGFGQYEISNFAVAGARSRHNLKYWQREAYIGLGLDAHSMVAGPDGTAWRWAQTDDLRQYGGESAVGQAEAVSERAAFEETIFLGLRLAEGLPSTQLADFPDAWQSQFAAEAEALQDAGLMRWNGDAWTLTRRGQMVSSEVFGELLAGAAA